MEQASPDESHWYGLQHLILVKRTLPSSGAAGPVPPHQEVCLSPSPFPCCAGLHCWLQFFTPPFFYGRIQGGMDFSPSDFGLGHPICFSPCCAGRSNSMSVLRLDLLCVCLSFHAFTAIGEDHACPGGQAKAVPANRCMSSKCFLL